jgi:hypothetical protein
MYSCITDSMPLTSRQMDPGNNMNKQNTSIMIPMKRINNYIMPGDQHRLQG